MAICEISNGKLVVSVDSLGAELKSLRRVDTEKEYMWCGDAKYWNKTSPILFPQVGGLKNGEYRFNDETYKMPKHGFARDKEFQLMSHESTEIWFVLEADEETKKIYPFDFKLEIGYRLENMTLKVLWRVQNPSEETIYFSIGGHPAFNCPIHEKDDRDNYYLGFDAEYLRCTVIGGDGLISDKKTIYELEDRLLPISEELFERDAVIMEDYQVDRKSVV